MDANQNRVFLYHAHGYAIGGRISAPLENELNSHAATTLSIVGGYSSANSSNYQLQDLLSYRSARTYISGIQNDDGMHSTAVDTVVEGLNIMDMITADAVIGRLSSKHDSKGEAKIIPLGSSFVNLKIAGKPVDVELIDDLFSQHPTHSALMDHFNGKCKDKDGCAEFETADELRYEWGHRTSSIPSSLEEKLMVPIKPGWRLTSDGQLHCSLVRHVHELSPSGSVRNTTPYCHAIKIPQVGRLYLGEMSSSTNTKRLTMMRLELGSPVVGRLAVAGPETNGKWYP